MNPHIIMYNSEIASDLPSNSKDELEYSHVSSPTAHYPQEERSDTPLSNADSSVPGEFDLTFSFSCGGWFQMYFFGAAHALVQSGVLAKLESDGVRVRFAGSSAGALAACTLASGQHDYDRIREFCLATSQHFRSSYRNLFKMKDYLESAIDHFGENLRRIDTDPEIRAKMESGCLEMSVTTLPRMRCKTYNSFSSCSFLEEVLMASCCMVPLVGFPFKMKHTGDWVVDGGFSNFTPYMNDPHSITVSGMYFQDTCVRPRTFIPSWWAFYPPNKEKFENLFWMGYNDMIDFFVSDGLLSGAMGEMLLRPEVEFASKDSILDSIMTFCIEVTVLICVRPVIVVCVYTELAISMAIYALRMLFSSERQRWVVSWYDSFRSSIFLRTFGRLLFGTRVPNNEVRLEKGSKVFRVFNPIALGGQKRTGRECVDPDGAPVEGRVPALSPTARQCNNFPRIVPHRSTKTQKVN